MFFHKGEASWIKFLWRSTMRIIIGGQPNCGKSTLTASVCEYLRRFRVKASIYEIDIFTNTIPYILLQKPWSQRQKRERGKWQEEEIGKVLSCFHQDKSKIVLGDLPGLIDHTLEKMIKPSDVAIVVGRGADDIKEWLDFFKFHKKPIILKILSARNNESSNIDLTNFVAVHDLNRLVLLNREIARVASRIMI